MGSLPEDPRLADVVKQLEGPRWAAFLLLLFIIPVSLVYHNFWTMEGAQAAMNKIQFLKNVSIMGGMLLVAAFGPGRYSLDKG